MRINLCVKVWMLRYFLISTSIVEQRDSWSHFLVRLLGWAISAFFFLLGIWPEISFSKWLLGNGPNGENEKLLSKNSEISAFLESEISYSQSVSLQNCIIRLKHPQRSTALNFIKRGACPLKHSSFISSC